MRDLASIVTVDKVWPLEGKDRVIGCSFIENGYEAMVGKETQPGQLVVFIQEGAILPVKDEWEFLRKRCFKEAINGFLIKPMKFSTIKSWGLVVPLNEIEELKGKNVKAGDDITELLDIRKYEPEEDASPKKYSGKLPKWIQFCLKYKILRFIGNWWLGSRKKESGSFPTDLISKSDETTIQNMKDALEKFKDSKVYVTAKMEGQSVTVVPVFKRKKFQTAYCCSRNNAYPKPVNNKFWETMNNYGIIDKMRKIYEKTGKAYIFQCEQVGPGIQSNIYNFNTHKWFVYTVKDYFTLKQLPLHEAFEVAAMFDLPFVPVLESEVRLGDIMPDIASAVAYAEKAAWYIDSKILNLIYKIKPEDKLWKTYFQHEGVVVRTMDCDKDANIGCSFKVKNSDYAEKGLGAIRDLCSQAFAK